MERKVKEVSPDKRVTHGTRSTGLRRLWIQRSISLANVRVLRMRSIERVYGSVRRLGDSCGCQSESRFPLPEENARLVLALHADENRGHIRETTLCSLLPTGWLILPADSAGFSWFEIIEIENISKIFEEQSPSADSRVHTVHSWQELGRGGSVSFRMIPKSEFFSDSLLMRERQELILEILRKNRNVSHVNLCLPQSSGQAAESLGWSQWEAAGLVVERNHQRWIPDWQSGDMAIRLFTIYTLTRKDT
jgi:hypothetical protein